MKTTKLVAFGLVSMTVLGLGTQGAQAASVSHDATSHGYVNLKDTWEETGIIDPPTTGPEVVVPPITPPIVGEKNLALIYYPDFYFTGEPEGDTKVNFGDVTFKEEAGKTVVDTVAPVDYDETNGTTLYAKAIPVENSAGAADGDRPLFVQVRSTVASWKLTAQASDFVSNIDGTSKLNGAQIIITNITPQQNTDGVGQAATASALKTVTSGKDGTTMQGLDISSGAQEIGTMTGALTTDVSRNSFMFGTNAEAQGDNYRGVQLEIPAGQNLVSEKDADGNATGGYTADLTWTLSSDAI